MRDTFGWRVERRGAHATIHVWRGPEGSRGKLGELTGRVEDIQELERALALSNAPRQVLGTAIVSGDRSLIANNDEFIVMESDLVPDWVEGHDYAEEAGVRVDLGLLWVFLRELADMLLRDRRREGEHDK